MTNKNDYLIIPRSAFYYSQNNDQNINLLPEELYVFAWLYRHRLYDGAGEWISVFSVDGLSQRIRLRASIGKDNTRNKNRIKEILINLYDKGYIESNVSIDNKITYCQLLDILYPKFNGYDTNITYQIFDQFEDPLEFFVYACIDRQGEKGINISYSSWEKIAGCKKKKLIEVFDKMNSYQYHTRIWKFSGDYYLDKDGKPKQKVNQYYTRPKQEIKSLWNSIYGIGNARELPKKANEQQVKTRNDATPFDHHTSLQLGTFVEEEIKESINIVWQPSAKELVEQF